jgi:phosphomevalonate kinase
LNNLELKFDKFSSEVTRILECVSNEFNTYKEKQRVIEMQHDILMSKMRRLEEDKYSTALPQAETFVNTNDVNEELLSKMKPEEECVVRIAVENKHQCDLLKETQELNHALARQQDSSNNIEALLNYVKDIFVRTKPPTTTYTTTFDTEPATSAQEDSDMSSRRL